MLKTEQLYFEYSPQAKFNFPDIICAEGDTLIISGESGSGKTTLLSLFGCVIYPSSGEVFIDGEKIRIVVPHLARRRLQQADEQLHQYRFARTTSTNDEVGFAFLKLDRNAFQHLIFTKGFEQIFSMDHLKEYFE